MNKLLKSFFTIIFILLNLANAKSLIFTPEEKQFIKDNKITVALLPSFYPFSFHEQEEDKGFSYDLLNLISTKSGLKLDFVIDTWTNHYKNFENQKIDIITSISYTKKRAQFINFTKPYFEVPLMLHSRYDLTSYDGTLDSLRGKKIGIIKDIFYLDNLKKTNLFEFVFFDSSEDKIKALHSGKIDIFVGNLFSTKQIIDKKKYNNIKILDEFKLYDIKKEDFRFGVHKSNPILFSILNKTYKSLSHKKVYQIKEKWLGGYPTNVKTTYDGILKLTKNEQEYLKTKKIIRMCNLHNFAPIEFLNKHGHAAGISIDTIRLIEKKLNYNIAIQSVKTTSNEESIEFFERKLCDILPVSIPSIHKYSYEDKHTYTLNYLDYEPVIITRKEEPFIYSLDDIKYKGIAYKNNPKVINHLKKTYPGINIIKTKTYKEAFDKVSSGEVYATMSILPLASYNITKYALSNLKIAGHTQKNVKFSIAVNSDDPQLVSILNKSLKAITQREKSAIFNKWANIPFEKNINYSRIVDVIIIALFIIILLSYRQYVLSKTNVKLQKAKDKLVESNNRIVDILESTVESILISKNGIITECNKMALIMYGYTKEEMIGMNLFDVIQDDSHTNVRIKQKSKRTKPYEINIVNKEGIVVPALVRGSDIVIDGEKHRVSIALDLTELKVTQKALEDLNRDLGLKIIEEVEENKKKDLKLLHQARHAQMGELINMIAHQWRQPLNAIAATIMNIQLQLSLDKFDLSNENERNRFSSFIHLKMENIENFIQTLSVTIDDFRNFYKQDNKTKKESIHIPINKALGIIKALVLSKKITIVQEFHCTKNIEIFESELLQVFLNIIKNAQDNFEDRHISNPIITIATKDTKTGVVVEICDNGGGIKSDIIDNIFDPYFSTKETKNGTGLGLYMSKSIIEKHHKGKFYAQNKNDGICFTLELYDNLDFNKNIEL